MFVIAYEAHFAVPNDTRSTLSWKTAYDTRSAATYIQKVLRGGMVRWHPETWWIAKAVKQIRMDSVRMDLANAVDGVGSDSEEEEIGELWVNHGTEYHFGFVETNTPGWWTHREPTYHNGKDLARKWQQYFVQCLENTFGRSRLEISHEDIINYALGNWKEMYPPVHGPPFPDYGGFTYNENTHRVFFHREILMDLIVSESTPNAPGRTKTFRCFINNNPRDL